MNEAKLQEIETRAREIVQRCSRCDAPARWSRPLRVGRVWACNACRTPHPEWEEVQSVSLDAIDLGDEVRRLTDALATVTAERDVLRGDLGAAAILRGESPVTPATEALSAAERLLGRLAVDDVINDGDGDGGAPDCTGITAQWCPRCGDCACPLLHEGNVEGGRTLNDPKCPLHAPSSPHGDAPGGAT